MSTLATMVVKLVGDVGGFTQSLDHAESKTQSFTASITSKFESAFGGIGKIAGGFVVGNIISAGLGKIGDAVGDLKAAMIDGNAEFERYQVQFGVLLGSSEAAEKRLKELADFGAKTPFELPEVVRADKVLQSFGLHAQDAAKRFGMSGSQIRTVAGDVAAGTGASFEEIAGYLGKFSSGATGESIARFQELGIVTRKELAEMGLRFSKSGELLSPLDESMTVLLKSMQGKFGGIMDAQSGTFEGMLSNMKDWIGQAGRVIGKPIFEKLKVGLKGVLDFLTGPQAQAALEGLANGIASFVDKGLGAITDFIDGATAAGGFDVFQGLANVFYGLAGTDTASIFQGIGDALIGMSDTVQPVIDSIGAGLQSMFTWAQENGPEIGASIGAAWQNIRATVEPAVAAIGQFIQQVFGAVGAFLQTHGTEISAWIGQTWTTIRSIVEPVIQWFYETITTVFGGIATWIGENQAGIQAVFQGVWDGIKMFVGTVLEAIRGIVNAVLALLRGDVQGALDAVGQTFRNIWDGIKDYVGRAVETVRMILLIAWAAIQTGVSDAWGGIRAWIENAWQGIIDFFNSLPGRLVEIGRNIIQGLIDGVKTGFENLGNSIRQGVDDAIKTTKKNLGIQSPSTVFADIGANMMRGMSDGILANAALPQLALNSLALATPDVPGAAVMQALGQVQPQLATGAPAATTNNSSTNNVTINIAGVGREYTPQQAGDEIVERLRSRGMIA
jgi:phage-related protein